MKIEITPLDTLFFRDGKPFSMGDDTWATGVFPPLPSVFYGMIRTAYATQNNIQVEDIQNKTKSLIITSILMKYDDNLIFPYPADLYSTTKLSKNKKANFLKLVENNTISKSSISKFQNLLSTKTAEKTKDYFGKAFLSEKFLDFSNYLNSTKKEFEFIEFTKVITSESKVGIGKDLATNITSESKLYRVGMQRLENKKGERITFEINFEGLDELNFSDTGFLKLGAENKIAIYKKSDNNSIQGSEIKTNYLKIYLATPAIFDNGELPDFIKKGNYQGIIDFELLTYAIGKPVYVGGFDMKQRKPKPMKKAVPAGSVYYLKSDNAQKLAEILHGKSISEQLQEQGFGVCYCGTFNI